MAHITCEPGRKKAPDASLQGSCSPHPFGAVGWHEYHEDGEARQGRCQSNQPRFSGPWQAAEKRIGRQCVEVTLFPAQGLIADCGSSIYAAMTGGGFGCFHLA